MKSLRQVVLLLLTSSSVAGAFRSLLPKHQHPQTAVGWARRRAAVIASSSPSGSSTFSTSLWAVENDSSSVISTNEAPDSRRPPRNNNNNNNRHNNNRNFNGNRTNGPPRGGRPNRGGGPPGAAMKLVNPMKLRRVVYQPPPRPPRDNNNRNNNNSNNNGRRPSPAGAASNRPRTGPVASAGGGGETTQAAGARTDRRTKRQPGVKDKNRRPGDSDNRARRPSLRLGTGRKGRAAQGNMRRGSLKKRDRSADKERRAEIALERRTIELPDGPLSVAQLAEIIDEKPVAVIKFLMTDLGVMASMTQSLDPNTCIAVAEGFGKVVGAFEEDEDDEDYEDYDAEESALEVGYAMDDDEEEDLLPRPPAVTIMGHVDHGKTSLLDYLRNTRVTAGEAGGITQHIAAYQVDHKGNKITFIDTPGHAAFTDMRQRGANITDIVILVVAADDGVKEQTADSIICARQAGVPMVVAINKMDLETANPERVKSDLTSYDVLTEDLGGDVLCSEISAKEGTNLDDLLDKVMLQADLLNLRANPDRESHGAIIEARVEKGLGTVATTLIQKGTLRVGDIFVAGETYGRVRALIGPDGKTRHDEAGPSMPISVVGFEGIPSAGDLLVVADSEQDARDLAESRRRITRERESQSYQSGLMSSVSAAFSGGMNRERREMCVVVKADVQGSAEALTRALSDLKLEDDEATVTVKVLVSEAGEVTKSDVAIAGVTPETTILAFNVAASYDAMEDARANRIPIEYYNIVYDAIESVESRMQEVLSPTPDGDYIGKAVVQEVFSIGGTGNIAGSRCSDGSLRKGGNVRVMRGDKILIESKIRTLRNFKAEVDAIEEGNECGIGLADFEDFQPDDVIECYIEKKK